MATLIMTAKLNDIDPQAWLADVLARIAEGDEECQVQRQQEDPQCAILGAWRQPIARHDFTVVAVFGYGNDEPVVETKRNRLKLHNQIVISAH